MNRKKKEVKLKSLYAAVKELDDLRSITWNAPLIKLPKPIQTGWVKTLTLRDDCKNRKDSHIYSTILEKIKVDVFCRKKDFLDKKGRDINAGVRIIRTNEWKNLGWPEHYKKYFFFGIHEISSWGNSTQYAEGYKFWQRFYFVDKIVPNFITHTRAKLPEVETRIAELESFIVNNGGWEKYYRYKSGHYQCEKDYTQPRFDMIEEIYENKIRDCLIYGDKDE